MKRRSFLQGMIAAPLGSLLFKPHHPKKGLLINKFSVAGFQYYDGRQIIGRMRIGEKLALIPEPANPYDEFAVKIMRNRAMVGYVPRSDNRHISRLLQQGSLLQCRVIEIRPADAPWHAVRVEVKLIETVTI